MEDFGYLAFTASLDNDLLLRLLGHFRLRIRFFFQSQLLREACSVFRHLILDDDIRVEFSKAHEHARAIASDVLIELTELLPGFVKFFMISHRVFVNQKHFILQFTEAIRIPYANCS